MTLFNPNDAAPEDSGIFGLPYTAEESKLVLLPVPWEATTSYGGGTSKGPEAILQASKQIDLFDLELGNFYEAGISLLPESKDVKAWNKATLKDISTADVNTYSLKVNDYVYQQTKAWLSKGKLVGLVGGDHSTPFGAISAYLEKYPDMGILHFDAHADLRESFEGYDDSHASIMFNVLAKTPLTKLVQVGIRDFCEDEFQLIQSNPGRVKTFFDADIYEHKASGKNWAALCEEIIQHLPQNVYISFDIDGLDPRFCPNTGTPVPGGLDFQEATYLIKKVAQSGRRIVGFDLNEVAPGEDSEWDANVGARLLYKLCGYTLTSI